jgi:hypothetical protein
MLKNKLNWRRPVFYLILPVLLVMIFLGFPLPIAPPAGRRNPQTVSAPARRRKRWGWFKDGPAQALDAKADPDQR